MKIHARHGAPIYRAADVRAVEIAAASAASAPNLMERAGAAAAELAREIDGGSGKPILVVAGPGNNGGDALVLARHLRQSWHSVTVVSDADEKKLSADARAAMREWRDAGGTVLDALPAAPAGWGLAVDGLFGIGLQRDVAGRHAEWIAALNSLDAPVLALDVPSGLQSDTGRVLGRAVRARHTVTFIGLKPGLLTLEGPDHCGEIHVRDLGIESGGPHAARGALLGHGVLSGVLAPRRLNSHKGHYGSVGIIGGEHGTVGAALLAARAALRLGAGRVYAGLLAHDAPAVDPACPELMIRSADAVLKLDHLTALAVGPGLGQTPDAAFYLGIALQSPLPLVLDADALNLVAMDTQIAGLLKRRSSPALLTPHPAEAARLLAIAVRDVQNDRVRSALELAEKYNCVVVLKGAGSICAAPDGAWHINSSGNPGMASAGTGDVLTGMISALLAQRADALSALLCAVWLHGAAADRAVAAGAGPVGLSASEIADAARALINGNAG
jgi:ADP-dependent NAD(P)H-hydrate dehydratase / NAD(P)H-hydrate epimerase